MLLISFLVLVITLIVWSFYQQNKDKKNLSEKTIAMEEALNKLSDFEITSQFRNESFFLAVDEKNRKVAFKNATSEIVKFNFSDVILCEILENGETTFRKVNPLGRALLGGVLAGGIGAVVGGSSAAEKEVKTISTLTLKVAFKSISNPSYEFCFFDSNSPPHYSKKGFKSNSPVLKEPMANLQKWKDIFTAIIAIAESTN